ncbi:MAG: hypothetical protein ACK56I_32405, partial [bacterium]
AVIRAPVEGGVLEGAGTEKKGAQLDRRLRLEGKVREEAVVAERDAQAGRDVEEEEKRELEPVQTVVPEVKWHGSDG